MLHLAAERSRAIRGVRVITGQLVGGALVPFQDARQVRRDRINAESVLAAAAKIGLAQIPGVAGFVDLLVAASRAVSEYLASGEQENRLDDGDPHLLPRLLRMVAGERPTAVFLDDLDLVASSWWAHLLLWFSAEIGTELPLVLCMSVRSDAEAQPLSEDEEPVESSASYTSRRLAGAGLADILTLEPLSPTDVNQWLGPMSHVLARTAASASGGLPGACTEVWRLWVARGLVVERVDGTSSMTRGEPELLRAVRDSTYERLIGIVASHAPGTIDKATLLLGLGALEGRTFTGDAIATAVGQSRDSVIDYLDDVLSSPGGLLQAVDHGVPVLTRSGKRKRLWRYRFARDIDWRVADQSFVSPANREQLALRLAQSLEIVYEAEVDLASVALTRLYAAAGEANASHHFRGVANNGLARAARREQARQILAARGESLPNYAAWWVIDTLVAASWALMESSPPSELETYAQYAVELAEQQTDSLRLAKSLRLVASILLSQDRHAEALARLQAALDTDPPNEWRGAILHEIGVLYMETDRLPLARSVLLEALPLRGESYEGKVHTRYELGKVEQRLGHPDAAQRYLHDGLAIAEIADDQEGRCACLVALGELGLASPDLEGAEAFLQQALAISRELQLSGLEAHTCELLGDLRVSQGTVSAAREYYRASRDLFAVLENYDQVHRLEAQVAALTDSIDGP